MSTTLKLLAAAALTMSVMTMGVVSSADAAMMKKNDKMMMHKCKKGDTKCEKMMMKKMHK